MKEINRTIVSAVIISQDQKILIGKVREGGVYPDCWHIPGGGVKNSEDKYSALTREIKEETGIDIKDLPINLLSDSDTGTSVKTDDLTGEEKLVNMKFNVYQVNLDRRTDEITISLNDDLREFKWVALDDLKNYEHTPPSQKLFKKLGWI